MPTLTYEQRRGQLETYFDRTAVDAWSRLTSDAPVGRIRATVRVGRNQMRGLLLNWLPADLSGCRVLDAGCGTGALAIEAARRGAQVIAIDLSPTLVALARERTPHDLGSGSVTFLVGDMFDPMLGHFDHIVSMDSLIHYQARDIVRVLAGFAARAESSLLFTFAPKTPLLAAMHAVGRLLPRGDRAPAIEPVREATLRRLLSSSRIPAGWHAARTQRIASGFYTSQAMELVHE
jgi:magnesium-protoporphyrin O-methyltransferase